MAKQHPDKQIPDPLFLALLGRGTRGKSFGGRWFVERAQSAGRSVVVADADRTNPTLSAHFEGQTMRPPSADDRDTKIWLDELIEHQIRDRFNLILDLGGGDLVLKITARELDLVPFLVAHNVRPVAVHLIGPDTDDLSYLRDLETSLFAPADTILILNEALVPAHLTAAAAFGATVQKHEVFVAAVRRGARVVFMPALKSAGEVDRRRLSFAEAAAGRVKDGQAPIGPIHRQRISLWLRAMDLAFAHVMDLLP